MIEDGRNESSGWIFCLNVSINFLTMRCDCVVKMTAKKSVEAKVRRALKTSLDKDILGSNISVSWKRSELLIRSFISLCMVPLSTQVHS